MEFGHLLLLSSLVGMAVGIVVIVIANKKGIDISSLRFILTVTSIMAMFFIIPILLANIPIKGKIFILGLSITVGSVYFTILYKIAQKKLRKK